MAFDPKAYGPEVAAILALDASGQRLMPLSGRVCSSAEARQRLAATRAADLFPSARSPDAALAGLFLYFSCWAEAHEIAQDISTAEGSYWHAIVHRQEPDAGNSAYWFRQVGRHPIFPALRDEAAVIGVPTGPQWDPLVFIRYCEDARTGGNAESTRLALETQRAEWQLLFDYCARAPK